MSEKTETRHIRERMDPCHVGERQARRIELRRGFDELCIRLVAQFALLERGAHDADAERLAEDQHVARFRAAVALHPGGMNEAERHEPVDRLQRVDGVATRDRYAGRIANRASTGNDALDHFGGDLADRHAEKPEREKWPRPHRIDVRQRVRRSDAPEIVRIVDDRHEEIGRGDNRLRVVQPIDRGVIARLGPDEQIRERRRRGRLRKHFAQQRWRELAASTAAVRELGQAECQTVRGFDHVFA